MARSIKPLSNTEVNKAKPKAKEYNLSDGQGLSIRIKTNGTKSWLFNYVRPFIKKRANLSFGTYPEVSLAEARTKRLEARALVASNIDPKEYKEEQKRIQEQSIANTLRAVAEKWFEVKRSSVTEDYATDIWRSLELHIFPNLGNYPITKIAAPSTISTMEPIAAKGNLETIKRLSQRLNEVMVYAVNTGLIHSNPLSGIKSAFQNPTKTNMPSLPPEELPELLEAISYASIKLVTRCLIEWQLHTMSRPGEAAGARWDEIDFEKRLWNIPKERMKRGRPHTVPLTTQALNILDRLKPLSGHRQYIFPADRDPKKHANEQTANAALKRMGFQGRLVAHGLRSIASTILNDEGFDPDIIEAALAHVDKNEVRRAYNRAEYIDRRRVMMDWWSNHISKQ